MFLDIVKRMTIAIIREILGLIICHGHKWKSTNILKASDGKVLLEFMKCEKCGMKKVKNRSFGLIMPYLKLSNVFSFWEAGLMTDEEISKFLSDPKCDVEGILKTVFERIENSMKESKD